MRTAYADFSFHGDGLGSVRAISDTNGNLTETYTYLGYGFPLIEDAENSIINLSLVGNTLMFAAREFDFDTGLIDERNRYYDSRIGTFISADPLGATTGVNLYQYVNSRPLDDTDPLGLLNEKQFAAFAACVEQERLNPLSALSLLGSALPIKGAFGASGALGSTPLTTPASVAAHALNEV